MAKFNSLSIAMRFALAFALVMPIALWLLVSQTYESMRSYQQVQTMDRQNAAANNLIAGVYEILMERLATNNALLAADPAGPDALAEITKRRTAAVQKIAAAYEDLNAQEFPNKAALMGELKGAMDKAASYRTKADAAIKLKKDGRDADTVKNLFVSMSELSATSQKVWSAVLKVVSSVDPELARLSSIRLLAWNLRDIAGFERSHVATGISAKAPIADDKLAAIAEVRAQIALMWRFLEIYSGASDHPSVVKGIQTAKEGYFGKFQPLADEMRKVSAQGAAYPMTLAQWVDTTTPQLFTLLNVMYGAGEASEAHTAALGRASMMSLTVSAGLMVIGLLLAAGAIWMTIKGVSRPIASITKVMGDLAEGNNDVEVPYTQRGDEVGAMAKSILVFRDAAREKIRLAELSDAQRKQAEDERRDVEAERQKNEAAQAESQRKYAESQAQMAADERKNAEAAAAIADEQSRVVQMLASALGKVSEGDLTARLPESLTGSYEQIKRDFNTMVERLRDTITSISASATEVTNAAEEISHSTTNLSQRTEEQAAGLEQTSASMEQISATVRKNAENAQHANKLTAGAREVAGRGGAVVASTVEAMSRIEESSNKIADIIGVIDEIARQTNLLALNAAVEAARAGDAGRGFAVVASEVRSLAQRSSQAAKDIKDLITSSSTQVKDGVDLVNKTGASLNEIVDSIKAVADIVADIATASSEQATGLDQVNKALTQMDEATQQNSALVEENAATAKTLQQQSRAMDEQVSFFQLQAADAGKAPWSSRAA